MRMNEALQIETPAQSYRLRFAGCPVFLRTNSERVARLAAEFFPEVEPQPVASRSASVMLLEGEARKSAPGREWPVFRGRREYAHADYGAHGSVWFDLKAREVNGVLSSEMVAEPELFRRSVLAVIAGILAPALGVLALHAGCIARNGKGILIAAPSGNGKSTMTLTLARRGWELLSDDWTFLAGSGSGLRAWGMQTALKLLPDAVRFFPELSGLPVGVAMNGEESFEFDPWRMFGVRRALEASPVAVMLLERNPQPASFCCRIEAVRADEARRALMSDIESQPEEITGGRDCLDAILDELSHAPAFRATIAGEPAALAAEIDAFLREEIVA